MSETQPFTIEEVSGANLPSTLTDAQKERLAGIDWFLGELDIVMRENKEYGVLQADWRHQARFEKWLYEGNIPVETPVDKPIPKDLY